MQNHTEQKGNRYFRVKNHDKVRIEGMNKALPNNQYDQSAGSIYWPKDGTTISHKLQVPVNNMIVSMMCLVSILGCINYTASVVMISYMTVLSV